VSQKYNSGSPNSVFSPYPGSSVVVQRNWSLAPILMFLLGFVEEKIRNHNE